MKLCYRGRTTKSSSWTASWSGPQFGAWHYLRMNIHTQCGFNSRRDGSKYSLPAGEYGEAQEVVDIAYAGAALRVGFNYQYLLDFFAAVGKTEPVRMELKDEQTAVQFCPVDQDTCD